MNLNTEQHFATVPRADIPRSVFDRSFSYKTTMDVNYLVPIFIDEALPGDSFKLDFTVFGRLINPLVCPVADELYLETLWFKAPMRILWSNSKKFFGEQDDPGDSTDFLIPVINSGAGFAVGSLADYFGIPTGIANLDVNSLPFRMYNLCYNQWMRDQNLINSLEVPLGDDDSSAYYTLQKSAKMHDYFTSCLPFAQKAAPVELPLGSAAPVYTLGYRHQENGYAPLTFANATTGSAFVPADNTFAGIGIASGQGYTNAAVGVTPFDGAPILAPDNLYADLSKATAANINDIRFAFQLQKYFERNAMSGTRYREYVLAHYGIHTLDASLQIPEFLGMTRDIIDVNTVVQTGGSSEPNGTLTAYALIGKNAHGFSTSFTEHSYVMGIARIRHNPLYQQGLAKMWSRRTLFDIYDPLFACIGNQPVLNKELVCQGGNVLGDDSVTAVDDEGFGFQEAWAEYRYHPSMITGKLRSNVSGSLDVYHFAQYFATNTGTTQNPVWTPTCPKLNQSFIEENIPIDRAIAVKDEPQFMLDFSFRLKCARPMPVHSIPGLVDHF